MRESRLEAAVGGIVLLVAAGALAYAMTVGGRGIGGDRYDLTASFRSVEGIEAGSDIRLAGVTIGKIRKMTLNTETYRADVTLAIDHDIAIPTDSTVAISSDGLLGGAFLEIIPGGALDVLADGEEILDTQGAVSLIGLLLKFVNAQGGD